MVFVVMRAAAGRVIHSQVVSPSLDVVFDESMQWNWSGGDDGGGDYSDNLMVCSWCSTECCVVRKEGDIQLPEPASPLAGAAPGSPVATRKRRGDDQSRGGSTMRASLR
jgi:hypothetical protein